MWTKKANAKHDQVQSEGEGGASVPDTEAYLRLRQGEISGLEEESQSSVRLLRVGESLPAPPMTGPSGGVVCLEAEKRPPDTTKQLAKPAVLSKFFSKIAEKSPKCSGAKKSDTCAGVP